MSDDPGRQDDEGPVGPTGGRPGRPTSGRTPASPPTGRLGALVGGRRGGAGVVVAMLVVAALPLSGLSIYLMSVGFTILFHAALAVGWNILGGYAGYESFGHVAFVGAGGYTTAVLLAELGWSPLATAPLAGLVAAGIALAVGLPVLRLRGPYFALVTLVVSLAVAVVVLNLPGIDASAGIFLPRPADSAVVSRFVLYEAMAATLLVTVLVARRVERSRFGVGLRAIREDEEVATTQGVPATRLKLAAFVLSAGLAGMAGGIFSWSRGFIDPGDMFNVTLSVLVVLFALLGGRRTWVGPLLGAVVVTGAQEVLTVWIGDRVAQILYGALLVVVILYLPHGLIGARSRSAARRPVDRSALGAAHGGAAGGAAQGAADASGATAAAGGAAQGGAAVGGAAWGGAATVSLPGRSLSPPLDDLLEVRGLVKRFGGITALNDVSFSVAQRSITALIGPNGSGKTTLFQVVSGLVSAEAGSVHVAGHDLTRARPEAVAAAGVGRAFQIVRPMATLTVRDNLLPGLVFGSSAVPLAATGPRADALLDVVGLGHKAHVPAGDLTLWEKKALEVARALSVGTRLLLLDEVFAGLSPADVDRMIGVVRTIRDETDATVLLVEHVMRATMALAEHIVVLSFGEVIATGTPDQVTRDPKVVEVYLGAGHGPTRDPSGAAP